MGFGPAYGTGRGGGAVDIFTKKDGNPAIFANTGARDTYFTTNPDELAKVKSSGNAVAIGTTNQITAAYVYKGNAWQAIATNFKGDKGAPGAPGDGIDYSHLEDNQVPKWDSKTKMFVSSGVRSLEDGSISLEPASLHLGSHTISSSAENVTFTNIVTQKAYAPLWQEVQPGAKTGYIRAHDNMTRVDLETDNSTDLVNPSFIYTAPADASLFGATIEVAADATNMEIHVELDGDELWLYRIGDLAAGVHTISFMNPADFKMGNNYRVVIGSSDGSDVVLKGSSFGRPKANLQVALWRDEIVASREWLTEQEVLNGVSIAGTQLSFTTLDGTTKNITLPAGGGPSAPSNNIDPIEFTSDLAPTAGTLTAAIPMYIFKGDTESSLTLPDTMDLPAGQDILLYVKNEATSANLIVRATTGNTIDSDTDTSFTVPRGNSIIFVSDGTQDKWHSLPISVGGGGQTLNTSQIIKSIQPTASGTGLVTTYYDDSSITTTFDPWVSDINKLNDAVDTLQKQLKSKTRYYVYKGSNTPPPDIPIGARGGYYFTFTGTSVDVVLPAPSRTAAISDGTILFVDNNSTSYKVTITTTGSDTIAGTTKVDLPAESSAWYVRHGSNWQELYSGYLPESHKKLIDEIKTLISASNTFMRDVGVQGDDPNAGKVECTELEFHKCKVTQDTVVPTKGIVKFEGTTFVNPDGSKITTDIIKLVGMELVDPLDGTPPKLLLLGGGNLPTPHQTSAYGFFSPDANTPDSIDPNSLPVFRNGRVTLHKDTTDAQYAYVILPPGEGTDAERIGELGGLPSYWAKSDKIYNIGGVSRTYTVFRSPYPFREQDLTLVIYH
ncbi:hypothetical protein ROCKET24_139 [Vibrio phage Rocket24]|uniref:Uncharacterized protein n=1 Tax=Vibrio phage Chester TaxID=2712961 RepID=A0A6G8R557_9CAUD|nr:hypothetical protein KNU88_gp166 [Vibrio phage Chester]QIG66241.1 hypothetical protein CILSICK_142 [Vibrio phage Cilsick]QIN96547.1 hypothetical protein CHESTER_144 [Vibrio phage Chester]WBU77123.1 hypothetical protein NOELLE_139 [Vibrio phage Noelle]WCD55812.1 hypothetical protein ROCKET24_139 [Vibrio phage Rocket24]